MYTFHISSISTVRKNGDILLNLYQPFAHAQIITRDHKISVKTIVLFITNNFFLLGIDKVDKAYITGAGKVYSFTNLIIDT